MYIHTYIHRCSISFVHVYAGKVMAALLAGLGDRSAGVRKAYADVLGRLTRVRKWLGRRKRWGMKRRCIERAMDTVYDM